MFATSPSPQSTALDRELHAKIDASIRNIVASGHWASYRAPIFDELTSLIADSIGMTHVRLCSSGSMAVELALRGCHLQAGDEVICSAIDYPGNLRAIRMLGACPVVIDTALNRWTIDVEQLEAAASPKTRAVLVSHLYGEPANVQRLVELCNRHDWWLIEDVCQMPGVKVDGKSLGSFGDVSTLSFGGSKPLSAGTGGAVLTSDPGIHQRISAYADRPSDLSAMSPLQAAVLVPQWYHLNDLMSQHTREIRQFAESMQQCELRYSAPTVDSHDRVCFYKIPLTRPVSDDGEHADFAKSTTLEKLNHASFIAGEPFRVVGQVVRGRGKLVSNRNAIEISRSSILLDHRSIPSSRERCEEFIRLLSES